MISLKEKSKIKNWLSFILAILIALVFFFLAQWIPLGTKIIYNNLLIITFFFIYGYLMGFNYGFFGACFLVTFLTLMLKKDDSFYWTHFFQFGLLILGTLSGAMVKTKRIKLSVFFSMCMLGMFIISFKYHSKPEYLTNLEYSLSDLQENSKFLVGHSGQNPVFNLDTIYLVNFGFRNCKPCRLKKNSLSKLRNVYSRKAFKIVEIHCFEDFDIFKNDYFVKYAETYHDSLDTISNILKIESAPTELIFDQKGRLVRSFSGFNLDLKSNYEYNTIKLINSLLHEN